MGFLQEFKAFALKGNVMDMAVGVIIGGAFGKIVTSLVNDVIMPPIGLVVGGVDFSDLNLTLKQAVTDAAGEVLTPAVTWNYGAFIQQVVDFAILAFCVFMMIKVMNRLMKKKEEEAPAPAPAPEPEPTAEEKLLTEIRDLLKERK
ncbi:MAG: large-conductance mechanosensitive channel protein MscL [Alistipes sp.]|nr:large-conductance mechanosensitive channel protein MscL [Alistipes sp.]MBR7102857.1 large-conductance mechanosensitive channel protein MscL [Tidjanibacter sp.]MBQ8437729.1 large-conductance mechanosensitive channel protein MscL [Alistipes sp.]MBQ8553463.1 large-conductance mechanosensitive channel protein MscL [Alistipes sp.]MBR3775326.1 large-conductance mechanosensitive channel protein MscL [Alistipes sp.]